MKIGSQVKCTNVGQDRLGNVKNYGVYTGTVKGFWAGFGAYAARRGGMVEVKWGRDAQAAGLTNDMYRDELTPA